MSSAAATVVEEVKTASTLKGEVPSGGIFEPSPSRMTAGTEAMPREAFEAPLFQAVERMEGIPAKGSSQERTAGATGLSARRKAEGALSRTGLTWEQPTSGNATIGYETFGPPPTSVVRIPEPKVTQEVRSYLVGDLQLINERVLTLVIQQARIMHVPIGKLRVFVKRSWEERFTEVVLQAEIRANVPQSLALWDAVGDEIARWSLRQPARVKRLLNEQYSVFIEPSGDE